ncbi:MAG: insulinase family protein [candidate division Zixibacteria bacterium]|nr:insulinase family protein [candidate division Zixibacteria bacterium]
MYWRRIVCLVAVLVLFSTGAVMADNWFDNLQQGGSMNGFAVEAIYLNGKDEAIGARMLHLKTGFTMDMFQLQSVPQALLWVNSPPDNDMGMPHTCEHLLLGKGSKGRYVASLEDMSLGTSTAYTAQVYTAYPFSSGGGNDVFFNLFKEKLDAMLHPDFSDEEIRREVCNIGVTEDPTSGEMTLDEKGTVYTEMVSAFEKHWYYLYGKLDEMVYGGNHPLSNVSGGVPSAIRMMTPEDLREFHNKRYQLNNMGMIVTYPEDIAHDDLLQKIDNILKELDTSGIAGNIPRTKIVFPPAKSSAQPGEIHLTYYPGSNEQDPGNIAYYWPADLELDLKERTLLSIFMYCLGGSQTSNLYNKFINSETRVIDLGANWVWSSVDDKVGHVVAIGISNVNADLINKSKIASLRKLIQEEIASVMSLKAGSEELDDFNARALSHLKQSIKSTENYLNSPPGFGLRGGGGGGWYGLMKELEEVPGFKKSMVMKEMFNDILSELEKDENIWSGLLAKCNLAGKSPYGVGCKADPSMLVKAIEAKNNRLTNFADALKTKYAVATSEEAIAKYKEEYDANTKIINDETAKIPMPKFLDNPPMSFDAQLDYKIINLGGSVPLVASTFKSMTSATLGAAFNLRSLPEDKLIYVPLLSDLITQVGVVKDGEVVEFADLTERLKNEILRLRSFISTNPSTGRVELMLRGSGSNLEESARAIEWMRAGLFSPYLEEDNLQRLRDVVESNIQGLRNRMKGSEEGWVQEPANSYRYQDDPLLLAGYCFLTQDHFMHRIKWRLMDVRTEETSVEVQSLFDDLATGAQAQTKDELAEFANTFTAKDPVSFSSGSFGVFAQTYLEASAEAQDILIEALQDLSAILPTASEQTAAYDWGYLSNQMKNDLLYQPGKVLEDIKEVLALIRHKDNLRMYLVSNEKDCAMLLPKLDVFVGNLNSTPVIPATYAKTPVVWDRMKSRYPTVDKPTYVGLINDNTRNGVFIFTADCANLNSTDQSQLLDYVAARLYGGGGAHSMFMKTWSAGLAYSNGLRSSETNGRIIYYAERCPDLATTMRFVVNELKTASEDPKLAEYAIAQAFVGNRGSNSYESRGAAMAANLADGITPEAIAGFRQRILALRNNENLSEDLFQRMQSVYGKVLIGYGGNLSDYKDGNYFIIGPEDQFKSLSECVEPVEGEQDIYRLYPRDFWITK